MGGLPRRQLRLTSRRSPGRVGLEAPNVHAERPGRFGRQFVPVDAGNAPIEVRLKR